MKKSSEKKKRRISLKLKSRILISFFSISIIPVIILIAVYSFTTNINLNQYGIEADSKEELYNNALMMSKLTTGIVNEIKETSDKDKKLLEDNSYLFSVNEKLREKYSFLVIEKEDEIIYSGTEKLSEEEISKMLPEKDDYLEKDDEWLNVRSNNRFLVKEVNINFDDGAVGKAYIISDLNRINPGLRRWLSELLLIGIIVLILTSLIMTLWIYWGVSKPINNLKKAAQNIRDGNLDFTIDNTDSVSEIRDLCNDFEEMRKRLKDSQEEKMTFDSENKELIRNISHDLKTPITAVKGYCEGIMDGVADTREKLEKYIRTIYNKANEMDRLINELTFYSKIDTNRMPYTFTKININEYFRDCADELELELERERVSFKFINNINEDVMIIADAEQLRRVIHNIVNNSVKYMDKEVRWIEIRLNDAGDFVQVDIADNGKGIAKKDLSRVFDRFYRTDASRNSTRGGSGIGLSIVRKIIEDHGGKVWAGGEEGVGTTISFVLRKYQEVPYSE